MTPASVAEMLGWGKRLGTNHLSLGTNQPNLGAKRPWVRIDLSCICKYADKALPELFGTKNYLKARKAIN